MGCSHSLIASFSLVLFTLILSPGCTDSNDNLKNGKVPKAPGADGKQTNGEADAGDNTGSKSNSPMGAAVETNHRGRELAEWVLSKGGEVGAYANGRPMNWDQPKVLPPGNIEPFMIKLEGAEISEDDLERFAGQLRLRNLYLNQSTITNAGIAKLKDLPELEVLQLMGTKITDAAAASLAGLPSVQQLYLGNTKLGDAGVATISSMPSITVLWLPNTPVTDAGLVDIAKMQTLFNLNLHETKITDIGVSQLAALKSLNHCDVRNTEVTEEGATALSSELPNGNVTYK